MKCGYEDAEERSRLLDYQLSMNEKFRRIDDLRYFASSQNPEKRLKLPTERDFQFYERIGYMWNSLNPLGIKNEPLENQIVD